MADVNLRHHHLISSEVYFTADEKTISVKRLNAVLRTTQKYITGDDLGKANVNIQMLFRQGIPDPEIQILDVVILSISTLGYMSDDQFAPKTEAAASEVHH